MGVAWRCVFGFLDNLGAIFSCLADEDKKYAQGGTTGGYQSICTAHRGFTSYRHSGLRCMSYKDHDNLIQYIGGIQGVCMFSLPVKPLPRSGQDYINI